MTATRTGNKSPRERSAELPPLRAGLLSSSDVGTANRARVLQALFEGGPTSRADLARQINVQRATVSTIVAGLMRAGVLVEGEARLPAGKREALPAGCTTAELERRVLRAAEDVLGSYRGRLTGVGITVPALCDPDAGRVCLLYTSP